MPHIAEPAEKNRRILRVTLPDDATIEAGIYNAIATTKPSLTGFPMSPETRFVSLGLESLEFISVVFAMEEAFDIIIVDRQLDTFRTVAEARNLVKKLMLEKDPA
jgi:acyl carrier protein